MIIQISKLFIFCFTIIFAKEFPIQTIPLKGLITDPKQEISGMDWHNENLFLLPENLGGYLFMIPKNQLKNAIELKTLDPILPLKTNLITPDYSILIPGFDGLEAISFYEDEVFICIEAENNKVMEGYIAWGIINPKTFQITIPEKNLKKLNTPIQINNMSFESIVIHNNNAILLYEANGYNLQKHVRQPVLSLLDYSLKKIDFPNIEYRLTDATKVYNNKFWAINYFWSGDKKKLNPALDKINKKFPKIGSHKKSETVERLIEFEIKNDTITISESEPIQLYLEDGKARNWEAIAKFNQNGFLIATDKYPKMILGYVSVN